MEVESIIFGLKETIREKDEIIAKQCEIFDKLEKEYGKLVEAYANRVEEIAKLKNLVSAFEDLEKALSAEIERLTKTLELADEAYEKQAEEIKTLKLALVDKIKRNEELIEYVQMLQKQVDELEQLLLITKTNINDSTVNETCKEITEG